MPIGAEPVEGGVSFRVWAPDHESVHVVFDSGEEHGLHAEPGGYFGGRIGGAGAGALYGYRLGRGPLLPDPASRFQPRGPSGPSEVVDFRAFPWTDRGWPGVARDERVLYELHVGTFTPEGTWKAAAERLEELSKLGITLIQLMPIGEFDGSFGWGYDGVFHFAPFHHYGRPDDVRSFVDAAHALGMGVVLDVVYNHVDPLVEPLSRYARSYFDEDGGTPWGPSFDFDGASSRAVREYVLENALYWIREYHLDGFRLDAVDEIEDRNPVHIVRELAVRARHASPHRLFIAAESQARDTDLLRTGSGVPTCVDALYNEDFHHAVHVALTGRAAAYRADFRGDPQELVALALRGPLYQGQDSGWEGTVLGRPADDLSPGRWVSFIQNHDQVANALHGRRLHHDAGQSLFRAATAFLLLTPGIPMLFQGQEYAASTPFLYFADRRSDHRETVRTGRADSLAEFPGLATAAAREAMADPCDPDTFVRCKLVPQERRDRADVVRLHRDLLRMRRETPAFGAAGPSSLEGSVLGPGTLLLRFRTGSVPGERMLLVNLGRDLELTARSEPLLGLPRGVRWSVCWHSEKPRYGGEGMAEPFSSDALRLPGHSAVVLRPMGRSPTRERGRGRGMA